MDAVGALRSARLWAACAVLAWSLSAVAAAGAEGTSAPETTRYAQIRPVCRPPAPGDATCMALLRVPVASTAPGATPYTLNDGSSSSGPSGGRTPAPFAKT
jgi:hypothetical protein